MRYFLLLVVILCFSKPGEAQNPGYLGKHVMVGLDFSYTPSFTRKYRINYAGQRKFSWDILYYSIDAQLDFIVSRSSILSASYTLDPLCINLGTSGAYLDTLVFNGSDASSHVYDGKGYFLEDFNVLSHKFELTYTKYFGDNLPPIGRYFSVGIGYGFVDIKDEKIPLYPGVYDESVNINDIQPDFFAVYPENVHYINLSLAMGNSFEIVKDLFINYELKFNIPFFTNSHPFKWYDYLESSSKIFGRENSIIYSNSLGMENNEFVLNSTGALFRVDNAVLKQNFIAFKIGLTYALF